MTLEEIKTAVLAGKRVLWVNAGTEVQHVKGHFYIVCLKNQYTIGLTWQDGTTLNGEPHEFYVEDTPHVV